MRSGESSRIQWVRHAVSRWFNLGFRENQLGSYDKPSPYATTLAGENLALMTRACVVSCALVLACVGAHVTLLRFEHATVAPSVPLLIVFAIIAALSRRATPPERRAKTALALATLFCTTWYAFVMYCDIVLQPNHRSVLACLAFAILPLLFDSRPRDNIAGSAIALLAFLLLEHLFVDPATRTMDVLGVLIAVIVGLLVSQRKTSSHLKEIIYLDMYRTATKVSIFVAQVDFRADVLHALQLPDCMESAISRQMRATTAFEQVGEKFVAASYRKQYDEFFDCETLRARLAASDQASFTFEDSRRRWCQATVIAQAKRDDSVETAVIIVRDIDEEKRQELEYQHQLHRIATEAKRANVSKTNFLRRMSHDIRTPINGIRGVLEIADHFPNDAAKQAECREKIRSSSAFLLSLVNNVLDMSKLESGALELDRKPFDIMEVSHEANTIMSTQAAERGVRIIPGDQGKCITHRYLIGSPLHLQQILLNLGGNAVKYNRPNGTVAMSCRELSSDGDTATFEIVVEDTGLGMSKDFAEHAFEPFSQEEQHAVSAYTGSGLGLAIVKELVELMGGTVKLESEEGVGSTFTVVVPFEVDHDREESARTPSGPIDLHGKHALLVEDDDLNAEIAEFILGNEGLSLKRASNGQEAVDAFAASAPGEFDMVFMDVMMPVMNGLDATRAIRALDRPDAADVPIFAMTANAFLDDEAESLRAGMTAHLTKPLEIEKIRETLANALK